IKKPNHDSSAPLSWLSLRRSQDSPSLHEDEGAIMVITIKDFPARLEAFLSEKLGRTGTVAAMRQLTGGASRDAWAADVLVGIKPLSGVVRRDKGGEIMPDALDRGAEFAVLQRAHQAGVLVPKPLWLCADADVLGAPFFVMERLEGES